MSWLTTCNGARLDVRHPTVDMINIEWIAQGLSRQPRFVGQTRSTITVAQHSVLVSFLCPTTPLKGLLHDASESVMCDVSSQLKHLPELAGYCELEQRLMGVIYQWAGVSDQPDDEWKHADQMVLRLEAESFHGLAGRILDNWTDNYPMPPQELRRNFVPWRETEAKFRFLQRYQDLTR